MVAKTQKGAYNHVEWVDLHGNNTLTEVAVLKRDNVENMYFIPLKSLDSIDRNRMFALLTNRNANKYELWDLMSQVTLGNGVNALHYFHQLVKVLTPGGQIINPTPGEVGAAAVTAVAIAAEGESSSE